MEAGLWERTERGYRFIDWHDYQPTKESVEESRRRDADRKKRGREAQSRNRSGRGKTSARTPRGLQTESSGPDPTRPGTSKEVLGGGASKSSRKKPECRLPSDWAPTEEHQRKAQQRGVDLTREAENFRLHAEANDRRMVNWNAAFTMWLNKAHPSRNSPPQQFQTSAERRYAQGMSLVADELAEYQQRKEIAQ